MAEQRARFNGGVAPEIATAIDRRFVRLDRAGDASSRFSYFESSDDLLVVAGSQEEGSVELALVYGLTLRGEKRLTLALPGSSALQTALRCAWLDLPIRLFAHGDSPPCSPFLVPDRDQALELFGASSHVGRVHHLGDRADWVEPLTAWAGANDDLMPAHRPDNRNWHCRGLRVLQVERTPATVKVTAGIDYTEPEGRAAAALKVELNGPISEGDLERLQEQVEAAIDERYYEEGSMYRADEHWLQSALREDPAVVGVEPPFDREIAALRCRGSDETGKPVWSRGYIDLLGADPQGSLRLVETKLGSDDLLVLQGLDYYIWAERHRRELMDRFALPVDAPLELHFVVGGKGGGRPHLSRYIAAQLDALAQDIRWRVHFMEEWFDRYVPDVTEVARSKCSAAVKEVPVSEIAVPGAPARAVVQQDTEASWADPRWRIGGDSARTARYRALQSWYREEILNVPPGRDRRGRLIASMLPEEALAERPGLNFITSEARDYAAQRAGEVLRTGGALDEDRLRRNMLSSMPLCFNIFGSLRAHPDLGALLSDVFDLDISSIDGVECEWAPERTAHLNDRTAFDAFVMYRDSADRDAFLAVETKYTEPFSQKEYDSQIYRDVTADSGFFREGASERLIGRATNQMWRMAMLASSMLMRGAYQKGTVAVLSLADDRNARVAVDGVRTQVVDESSVKSAAFEEVVETARSLEGLRKWADKFATRYLDLTPIQEKERPRFRSNWRV